MSQLPHAITNAMEALKQVYEAARLDDKTTLKNSIALSQDSSKIGSDPGNPDVVVFGDLNRFKTINDQHGHAAGDAALRQAGELLKTHFVQGFGADAYRQSGDEFVILFKKEHLELFKNGAKKFDECQLTFNDEVLGFSMSFGFVCTNDEEEVDFHTLVKYAERACITAKSQGEGTCLEWTPELEGEEVVSLRIRCSNCNTTIKCEVPQLRVPPSRKPEVCPICETRFSKGRSGSHGSDRAEGQLAAAQSDPGQM